jgi:tetratricopeptide (TPR) repeat protein
MERAGSGCARLELCGHRPENPYSGSAVNDRDTANAETAAHAEALFQRGLDLLTAGAAREAARAFRAAIAADGQHLDAYYGLVRALREAGQLERSIGAALALTVLTPRDPRAHAALALALRQAGHLPEAQKASARARVLEWKSALQSALQEPEQDPRA